MPPPAASKIRRHQGLTEKAKSYHGKLPTAATVELRRPKTQPDLRTASGLGLFPSPSSSLASSAASGSLVPRLTKVLVNVTVKGSLGPVHVVMPLESTVGELIAAAVRQYAKEGRRPLIPTADPDAFSLHYSTFSLESLDRHEQLLALGSRNFFLCPSSTRAAIGTGNCSSEADKSPTSSLFWTKIIGFLM
ncbi:hypothetical protein H6P81_003623 [Aristolochia fimbriata]|uniref:DUF7054 domain-containing protein n=1 Tax=Aristolochia fimbriata TaxID=158543 RepID=A0AAV7FG45_ARIFI|nr:hypothetical protein H6P81_003623 [Aristolochia fimbriata]